MRTFCDVLATAENSFKPFRTMKYDIGPVGKHQPHGSPVFLAHVRECPQKFVVGNVDIEGIAEDGQGRVAGHLHQGGYVVLAPGDPCVERAEDDEHEGDEDGEGDPWTDDASQEGVELG